MFDEEEAIATGDVDAGYPAAEDPMGEDYQRQGTPTKSPYVPRAAMPLSKVFNTEEKPSRFDINAGAGMFEETAGPPEPKPAMDGPSNPNDPVTKIRGGVKRIVSYLMGDGGADINTVKAAAAQVDPQGQMSPDDRNIAAVAKAAETQGPEAAWKLMQGNRMAYNAKQAFGYAALNGIQGKAPDIRAAVDAANQAAEHVLDGSSVRFEAGQGGVTATVRDSDGGTERYNLSPEAFRDYLNVGGEGQYDKVSSRTVPETLRVLAQGKTKRNENMPSGAMRPSRPRVEAINTDPDAAVETEQTNFGKTPSTMNLSGNDKVQRGSNIRPDAGYGDEREARAQRMFPGITQGEQAERWMAGDKAREDQNKAITDKAQITADAREGAAKSAADARTEAERIRADAQRDVALTKSEAWKYATDGKKAAAQIHADVKAAERNDKNAQFRLSEARKAIAEVQKTFGKLTPEQEEMAKLINQSGLGQARGQPQAPTPGTSASPRTGNQPAPQAAPKASPGQPPEPGAKFFNGSWYRRGPNGESQLIQ